MIRHPGIRRLQERHSLGHERVEIEDLGCTSGSLAKSEKARTRRSSDSISLTTIWTAWSMNARASSPGGRLAREHLLDGQPDRRQRVLQLVRRLPRERLPGRHVRQVDQPLAAFPELVRHVIERRHGAADLIARRGARFAARLQPARPVAAGEIRQGRGELLHRPAHTVSDEHERQQRHEPRRSEQQEQGQRESPPQVARIDRVHQRARLSELGGQLLHADAAQVPAVNLDAAPVAGTSTRRM